MLQTKGKTLLESSSFCFLAEAQALSFLILKRDVREKPFLFQIAELVKKTANWKFHSLFYYQVKENTNLVNNSQAVGLFLRGQEG